MNINLLAAETEAREALRATLPQRRHRVGQLAQVFGIDLQEIKNL